MVRLVVFLIVVAALLVVVLQNTTPLVALIIFGMQTPTLPLGIWVLGAIAVGILTTLLTAALLRLSEPGRQGRSSRRGRKSRRASRAPRPGVPPSSSNSSQTAWTPPAWTGRQPKDSPSASSNDRYRTTQASSDDDWEAPTIDDWEEWAEGKQPSSPGFAGPSARRSPNNRSAYAPPIEVETIYPENASRFEPSPSDTFYADAYDRYDNSYNASDDFTEPQDAKFGEQEIWDEWEEEENTVDVSYTPSPEPQSTKVEPPAEPEPPPRRIVEVVRKPQTTQQTGTIYSVSYRSEDDEEAEETPKDEESKDAEATAQTREDSDRLTVIQSVTPPVDATPSPSEQVDQPQEERIRVIIPPYHAPTSEAEPTEETDFPEPNAATPDLEQPESIDEEGSEAADWDDEDWETIWDEEERDPPTPETDNRDKSDSMGDREVWDDWDSWEEDDRNDEDDEDNSPSLPHRRPKRPPGGNPSIQL
ncbi:hypothetical protein [Vacuolonema iberomarrocanum]|uniref:hypothetical protein n=1 Tax=Vacuolonema iberomarrocanum TaxID=3454632 RepID=UPI001A0A2299|nr:hypothetical protein [filamentous cyanobacterium LEGE 07170]